MEFCKTVKVFDCTKFTEGALYYVHWRDDKGKDIKQIYFCDMIDKESNQILFKKIVALQGFYLPCKLWLGQEDVDNIIEVQEVEIETEYNVSWREWQIKADVQPEVSNATAKAFSKYLNNSEKTLCGFEE